MNQRDAQKATERATARELVEREPTVRSGAWSRRH